MNVFICFVSLKSPCQKSAGSIPSFVFLTNSEMGSRFRALAIRGFGRMGLCDLVHGLLTSSEFLPRPLLQG